MEKIKFLYRAFRYRYKLDPIEINFLLSNLKAGDTAIDIGCHKGAYLYWMRKQVGATGKCFAFEPQIKLYNYLNSIQEKCAWPNVQIENKGLSSKEGKAQLNIPQAANGTSPSATLNTISTTVKFSQQETHITTLDNYFYEKNITPALIKIDVEGHELEVLKGGENLLQTARPKILMECEQRHLNEHTVLDVFNFLENLGYKGFFFFGKNKVSIKQFDINTHQIIREEKFWEHKDYINNFFFE